MAPEMLDYLNTNTEYTNAVDLWAVGCISYRLVTGNVPFSGRSLIDYCDNKSPFPGGALLGRGISGSGIQFIQGLLMVHPNERLSASQALHHDWIMPSRSDPYLLYHSGLSRLTALLPGSSVDNRLQERTQLNQETFRSLENPAQP